MTQFEKLKSEISAMSLEDFVKNFIHSDADIRDYICSNIKVPHAQCINHQEHNCVECIKTYLGSVVEK